MAGLKILDVEFNDVNGGSFAFTAALKSSKLPENKALVQSILENEDPASFVFDEVGFAWKDLRVATSEILQARQQILSFGSCSFEEPREDLRALRLLK